MVGLAELEGLRGLPRLLREIRVMVGGLMSVMMTGMIVWVLVVLAGHDGVRRKAEKEMGMGKFHRVTLMIFFYSFIPVSKR
jgi:hypothetical protein